jgi:putative nucleotidyltransferase with HDIG domain
MTVFRLFEVFYFPDFIIISDRVILGTLVVSIGYLWIGEIRDRHFLLQANQKLMGMQDQLKQANFDTVSALINVIEAKDPYTRGHSDRVGEYSLLIANKIGLSQKDIEILKNACILHDIGKTLIPDAILNKKEKLTKEEWDKIKLHPTAAVDILKPLSFLTEEKKLILHHHEKYGGGGYPEGIEGDKIPLGARIMAVADSFDAMRSKRAYRDPLSEELILQELKMCSGTQFDPKIVDAMMQLLDEGSLEKIGLSS